MIQCVIEFKGLQASLQLSPIFLASSTGLRLLSTLLASLQTLQLQGELNEKGGVWSCHMWFPPK